MHRRRHPSSKGRCRARPDRSHCRKWIRGRTRRPPEVPVVPGAGRSARAGGRLPAGMHAGNRRARGAGSRPRLHRKQWPAAARRCRGPAGSSRRPRRAGRPHQAQAGRPGAGCRQARHPAPRAGPERRSRADRPASSASRPSPRRAGRVMAGALPVSPGTTGCRRPAERAGSRTRWSVGPPRRRAGTAPAHPGDAGHHRPGTAGAARDRRARPPARGPDGRAPRCGYPPAPARTRIPAPRRHRREPRTGRCRPRPARRAPWWPAACRKTGRSSTDRRRCRPLRRRWATDRCRNLAGTGSSAGSGAGSWRSAAVPPGRRPRRPGIRCPGGRRRNCRSQGSARRRNPPGRSRRDEPRSGPDRRTPGRG